METLTISKSKDMLQITNKNYKNIYEILSQSVYENKPPEIYKNNNDITPIHSLPNSMSTNDDMKNELTNYLRQQLNN